MGEYLQQLREEIEPLRKQLISHPVYAEIKTIENLQCFMEHHVFAVWDFMSLLKALQRNLTCVDIPWLPVGSSATRYLINEIVTGEESDLDEAGNRTSHFELYIKAMNQAGCNIVPISSFINSIRTGKSVEESMVIAAVPPASIGFVKSTFNVVNNTAPHVQAAVFTFGREDLIPGMFLNFVREMDERSADRVSTFRYYLERHIEVDGERHSQLAYKMTEELNGNDAGKWKEATKAVKQALTDRILLWDGILNVVNTKVVS